MLWGDADWEFCLAGTDSLASVSSSSGLIFVKVCHLAVQYYPLVLGGGVLAFYFSGSGENLVESDSMLLSVNRKAR